MEFDLYNKGDYPVFRYSGNIVHSLLQYLQKKKQITNIVYFDPHALVANGRSYLLLKSRLETNNNIFSLRQTCHANLQNVLIA